MSAIAMLAACAVVAVGATVQGSVGFGLGLVSAPVLALIDPRLVPGALLVSGLVMNVLMFRREFRSIVLSEVKWAIVGRLVGAIIGAAALAAIPRGETGLFFGVLVLLAVGISATGLSVRPTTPAVLGAGTISGFMATTIAIGGPPVALVYQHAKGPRLRGTLAGMFIFGAAISLIALAAIGRLGKQELLWSLALIPGIFIGYAVSGHTAPVLDRGYTRPAVLTISAAAGLALCIRHIF